MATEAVEKEASKALGQGRKRSLVLPPGYSWLSVPIPTEALDHLHIQARISGRTWRQYMSRFCMEAPCYEREAMPQEPERASGLGG